MRSVRRGNTLKVELLVELANRGEQTGGWACPKPNRNRTGGVRDRGMDTASSNRKKGILLIRAHQQQTGRPVDQSQTRTEKGQDRKKSQEGEDRLR